MQREILQPKPPFHPAIIYRDKGQANWQKLENMPENEQRIIVMKLEDDYAGKKKVIDAKLKGAKTPLQVLEKVVPQVWGKLTPEFDIDDCKLNFETL